MNTELIEFAKANVKDHLLRKTEFNFLKSSEKAGYLYFLSKMAESKKNIAALEESIALVEYFDPEFSTFSMECQIKGLKEEVEQCKDYLEKIVRRIRRAAPNR
jgi:hypothetical protein